MWHDSVCNTVQEPTITSTIVAKKTTTWGESGFPSEFLGAPTSRVFFQHLEPSLTLPDTIAREVVDQPLEFPAAVVRVAEACCRQLDAARILPVGRVATDEGWFTG